MAVSLTHTTVAVGTDAGNGEIRKAQWNENHTLTLGTNKLLGRATAGNGAVEEIDCTAVGRALLDDATTADQRTTLGLGTGDSPTFTGLTLTGVSTFSAGTALLPSLVPSGDPNTGMWFPAADTVAWSTNGSERLRVHSSGGISIGNTTNPGASNLSVSGSIELGNTTDTTIARAVAGQLTVEGKPIPYVLAQSGASVSAGAVTTEEVLATISVPGGAMGPNGIIQVFTNFSVTNSSNNKTLRVRVGGVSGTEFFNLVLTTNVASGRITTIANQNSASSQTGIASVGNANGIGSGALAVPTASVNTSNNFDIVITGQKASSGETLTLVNYFAVIYYGA